MEMVTNNSSLKGNSYVFIMENPLKIKTDVKVKTGRQVEAIFSLEP